MRQAEQPKDILTNSSRQIIAGLQKEISALIHIHVVLQEQLTEKQTVIIAQQARIDEERARADEQQARADKQQARINEQQNKIDNLTRKIAFLMKEVYGAKSERTRNRKMPSVAEALKKRQSETAADHQASSSKPQCKKRTLRETLRKKLPVIDEKHDIEACPYCQSKELVDLKSAEISEAIEYFREKLALIRHSRPKHKCKSCQKIVTAPAPSRVIDGCVYGPGLHAHVVVAKCADALPIHRQVKILNRQGLSMERSTLTRLYHRTGELLTPIAQQVLKLVAQSKRINADETPMFIQAPEKCRQGYVWIFVADKRFAYVFSASRSGQTPLRILQGTTGTLQVDMYGGYNMVCDPGGRERVGCMAHIRRKFFNASDTAPLDAEAALNHILSLYEIEYMAAESAILGTEKHYVLRQKYTKPRLLKIQKWMHQKQAEHLPKSPMGEALRYALNAWPTMQPILKDPKLRLDNNLAENALRIIALGRKNFLFVGHRESGENLAVLQTIISTCLASEVDPEAYIADVLLRLDSTPASEIDTLLPENWHPR